MYERVLNTDVFYLHCRYGPRYLCFYCDVYGDLEQDYHSKLVWNPNLPPDITAAH